MATQVRNISIQDIQPSELNPRKTFDQEELEELAQSIKENGLVQPITVRRIGDKKANKFEIVCGERRYRACQLIGADTIQAIVKDLDDKKAFACMIIENLQRKDIDPMEEAAALNRLFQDKSMTVTEMAKMLGKSTSFVSGRIQLNNTIPEFVELMRKGPLVLTHLLDICKLPQDQQKVLYDEHFTEASRERWTYKFPNMPQLHEMIDKSVMNFLSTARFGLTDESFDFACPCDTCPLNTKNNPDSFKDVNNPRCMKRECFMRKTREAVFREAKQSGVDTVFSGPYAESAEILKAAEEFGLEPTGMGQRSYVLRPEAPNPEVITDPETYQRRLANYEKVKAVFDDNLKDGTVSVVYEICYNGLMSGELKYAYAAPSASDEPFASNQLAGANQRISDLKTKLHESDEKRNEEMVERMRSFFETSHYASDNEKLSKVEERVFRAILAKRLPQPFKESIGIDAKVAADEELLDKAIQKSMASIMREIIRSTLSEKSVNFSKDLAAMLGTVMESKYRKQVKAFSNDLDARFGQMKANIQAKIDEIRLSIQSKPAPQPEEATTEADAREGEETADENPAKDVATDAESSTDAQAEETAADVPSDSVPSAEESDDMKGETTPNPEVPQDESEDGTPAEVSGPEEQAPAVPESETGEETEEENAE